MKKIEILITDETAEALGRALAFMYYRNYPIEQAYGLLIDDLVSEIQKLPLLSCRCCCVSPPHSHPPSWCL